MARDELSRAITRHKSACTRAANAENWEGVIRACDAAFADFDRLGWPDNWSHFQRAKDDAESQLSRGSWRNPYVILGGR